MEMKPGQIWRSKKNDEYVVCLLRPIGGKVLTFHDGNWVDAQEWTVMQLLGGKEESGLYLPSDMMELVTHEYLPR